MSGQLLALLGLAASAAGQIAPMETGTTMLAGESTQTSFNYRDDRGPAVWGTLDPAWEICDSGSNQSPINIVQGSTTAGNDTEIAFSYSPVPITILNNGKTLEFQGLTGNSITIGSRVFNLVNIHFHAPSEHTFNGGSFAAEVHFVHADADGALAVIGVMIVEGATANPAFTSTERLQQLIPDAKGLTYKFDSTLDIVSLLPATRDYYHYMGSLTVPPCSENVAWHVMLNPITMSGEQVRVLLPALQQLQAASKLGGTNRPVQPIGSRTVFLGQNPAGLPPASPPSPGPTPPTAPEPVMGNVTLDEITGTPTSFDYNPGPIGPANWTGSCQTGLKQSPIDIVACDVVEGVSTPIEFNYATSYPLTVTNTGKGLLFPNTNGGTATIAGRTLNLLQFHIHSLSEHTFQGGFYPMEFHFVHQDANDPNQLAVLGVMIQEGAENPAFTDLKLLRQILPTDEGVTHLFNLGINYFDLMPSSMSFFHYEGSLTTPPCSENVLWHVFEQPVTMSRDQINVFLDVLQNVKYASAEGYTNRPVQPLNARNVYRGYPAGGPTRAPTAMPTVPVSIPLAQAVGTVSLEASSGATAYDYRSLGPDVWHTLAPEWAICRDGTEQSPIDIVTASVVSGVKTDIELNYQPAPVVAINKGSTIQLAFPANNNMTIGSRTFTLLQCHMHTTSEHTIDSGSFPIELHFVHADANGNLAVLGVMVQEGEASPVFPHDSRLEQYFPDEEGVSHTLEEVVHFEALFPTDRTYYHYMGSLTTPPCSENVAWHVFRKPITMSKSQINVLLTKLGQVAAASEKGTSNRPVMPIGARTVYLGQNPAGLPNPAPSGGGGGTKPAVIDGTVTLDIPKTGPTFNYREDLGPDVWHTLAPEWAICQSGREQSPIDIVDSDAMVGESTTIEFSYTPTPVHILNNGKTLEFKSFAGNSIKIGDTTFNLVNIHLHHNSEHLFNGGAFALEVHFVHADASGNLAVLGSMVEEGAASDAISGDIRTFEQLFPQTTNVEYQFDSAVQIDMSRWLPADKTFYHYMGSLTVPPCSQNVRWHVFQQPITMSRAQMNIVLSAMRDLEQASQFGFTHRPVQPLNGRTVTVGYPAAAPVDGSPTVSSRVRFSFEYFSATAAAQAQFVKDFTQQMAMGLGVSEGAVRITNLEKGSTIVTSTVTPSFDRVQEVTSLLADPAALFTTESGWNVANYGAASSAPEGSTASSDDDDDELKGDRLAIVIVVCVILPILVIANIIACCYLINRKPEKVQDDEAYARKSVASVSMPPKLSSVAEDHKGEASHV